MPRFGLKIEKKERRGPDTCLSLLLFDRIGSINTSLEFTLHNTKQVEVDAQAGGMRIITKDDIPVYVIFQHQEPRS